MFGRFSADGRLKHLVGEGEGLHRSRRAPDPFSPYPHAVIHEDSLFFMNGVDGRVAVFEPDHEGVARTFEIGAPDVETSAAWSALMEKLRAEGRSSLLQRIPDPRLTHTPSLAGMLVDDAGFLWVKVYDPTSDSVYRGAPPGVGGEWWVVTSAGERTATVRMPAGVIPLQVKGDRLLGIIESSLDVQRIVVHTITR